MARLETSAPGGREGAQENPAKPGHGANAGKKHHGQQGKAQQNEMVATDRTTAPGENPE